MYIDKDSGLAFIDSAKVKVFPSGRRRSLINDGNDINKTYIPFDAEARLNTEANNRKHTSLNGYKQSFINSFENGNLSLVIGGYLFEIKLDSTIGNFATEVDSTTDVIYANIKLEDIMLFAGTQDGKVPAARTTILRDQTLVQTPETCLDIPYSTEDTTGFYFSGLSFSSAVNRPKATSGIQEVISLRILERTEVNGRITWQLCEKSKLPNIDHGDVENSVKVGILEADAINVKGELRAESVKIGADGDPAVALKVKKTDLGTYQLNFIYK